MEARFSAPVQTGPGAHPTSCTMGTGSFPGYKERPGRDADPSPLLVPWSRKSRAITLLSLWAVRHVQSLGACRVELYLYTPYGPYSLYRASVPVQYSYISTPPMAVRHVQSLSACTVELYLYSPDGRTACTESQCLYSRAIPLFHLWAIRSVQSLSACTVQLYLYSPYEPNCLYRVSVPVQYSYTSTPPMGRTACTGPQCLYSRAKPLLALWAVRPVQSLSACRIQLYLYSPYGPYGLYRA